MELCVCRGDGGIRPLALLLLFFLQSLAYLTRHRNDLDASYITCDACSGPCLLSSYIFCKIIRVSRCSEIFIITIILFRFFICSILLASHCFVSSPRCSARKRLDDQITVPPSVTISTKRHCHVVVGFG